MSSRNPFAFASMACLLALGFIAAAPLANAESSGQSFRKLDKSARNSASKRPGHRVRIHLPVGPTYVYYNYPYYYSRGYYPTHIGGYVYYPYYYYRKYYARYRGHCYNRDRRCVAKWGYRRGSPRHRAAHRK